jgi:hypothetical protein
MKIFENVASMKLATLTAGQLVETKGYYSPGDGGQARYLIQTAVDYGSTPDEYGNHTLANGNVAVLQYEGDVNVAWFGAVGDGATDNAGAAQAALGKGNIYLLPGAYRSLSTLVVPQGRVISGYGAKIYNDVSHAAILNVESDCEIYGVEFEGFGNSIYDPAGIGITFTGDDVSNYKQNLRIIDCTFSSFGFGALSTSFAKNVEVSNCRITECGYVGVGASSAEGINISNCEIDTISPGTGGNAYGVFFTRANNTDISTNPSSKYCSVKNSTIKNNAIWEALDTHGGENIEFIGNTIINCRVGVALVNSTGLSAAEEYSPKNIMVKDNYMVGIGTGEGVGVEGVSGNSAENILIQGNILDSCGILGSSYSTGAIEIMSYTKNVSIKNNIIKNSYNNGIANTGVSNVNLIISDNIVEDVTSDLYANSSGIYL